MNKQQRETYRQQLLALAARLKGDVSSLRESALRGTGGDASGNLSNAPLHLADLGTDNFEQEVAVGLLQNGQQTLGAIAAALDRLDAGTYGRCEGCGKAIPEERLKAMPYASRCVACEEREEQEGAPAINPGEA
jgi:DnaK suppressor protein